MQKMEAQLLRDRLSACVREFQHASTDDEILDVFNTLFALTIEDDNNVISKDESMFFSVISLLNNMIKSISQENIERHYLQAFRSFYIGTESEFFAEIELYIKQYKSKIGDIPCAVAELDIMQLINLFAQGINTHDERYHKLRDILKRSMPESAFAAYIEYSILTNLSVDSKIRALERIISIDDEWYLAYLCLGDVYYDSKKWLEAVSNYETACNNPDYRREANTCFDMAFCYGKLGDRSKAIKWYKQCLRIEPSYINANNNLGYEYHLLGDYDKALHYYGISIGLGTDGFLPYRNMFSTLLKSGRREEALLFSRENAKQFNTKYYKEIIEKIAQSINEQSALSVTLQQQTATNYAGTLEVFNGNSGISLYLHQQEAIRKMNQILSVDGYSGLLVLPTGGGKTLTATYWLMSNLLDSGHKVVWLAHRHELLNQAHASFKRVCYSDVSHRKGNYKFRIISGQHDRPVNIKPDDDIIIASKTSLQRGFQYLQEKWLAHNKKNVFLVIDEAHHATAKEYRSLIDKLRGAVPSLKILGLTATPFRTAESEQGLLKKIFPDDIVYKIDLRELINQGILAEPIFEEIETNTDMAKLFQQANATSVLDRISKDSFFDIDSIGEEVASMIAESSERNNLIARKYLDNVDEYGQTLVFALNKTMAIALNGVFRGYGIASDFVISDTKDAATGVTLSTKDNEEKIQRFRNGELKVLINVNILTEGTDLPQVHTVFLTRPTKSTILMTQMIGRALRGEKAGGTKDCHIVSFVDDWQNRIAWVNPEQLFIDENVDFNDLSEETRNRFIRLISIQKIEEFAKIANETLDERLEHISFIERVPIGIYRFSYLTANEIADEAEEQVRNCNILVYDCMQEKYQILFDWLPRIEVQDPISIATHVNSVLFTETDRLIGYREEDIADIVSYYKFTGELPDFVPFTERNQYDVSILARKILEERMDDFRKQEYIKGEWEKSGSRWAAFYGVNNLKAFRLTVVKEIEKLLNPEDYQAPQVGPLTRFEQRQIQDYTLEEIRQRFPELAEKIRSEVFRKYTDDQGYYFSARSGYRSKRKLDFQIDHIIPMSRGGKTVADNLQLLTRAENMRKSDR